MLHAADPLSSRSPCSALTSKPLVVQGLMAMRRTPPQRQAWTSAVDSRMRIFTYERRRSSGRTCREIDALPSERTPLASRTAAHDVPWATGWPLFPITRRKPFAGTSFRSNLEGRGDEGGHRYLRRVCDGRAGRLVCRRVTHHRAHTWCASTPTTQATGPAHSPGPAGAAGCGGRFAAEYRMGIAQAGLARTDGREHAARRAPRRAYDAERIPDSHARTGPPVRTTSDRRE